ncbi:nucleotide pyrophosphatase, variant 2 [Coprinopsis cinerea AmutBmut pab1-1]|nr:nucleotide pyrophosphatase, variant 2 [Coprinopsis cinerea AmutBmut pab1-1]
MYVPHIVGDLSVLFLFHRTGLYAESHGIVANEFWDPVTQETFHYNRVESAWKSKWWLGEPMWETAEKAGVITANLMWPGPPKTSTNTSSTYFVPWRDHVPLGEKLDQILQWIDLPLESRPQLIVAYEPSLDQAGHSTGPNSARVNATLVQVDSFAKDLNAALEARNLTNIVDIVFVSDHGMTDTSDPEVIYLDDILGTEGVKAIHHVDGWPAMGLRFREDANITQYLSLLLDASAENPEKFKVYTTETMPKRFHFSKNERIAPIWVVPKIGYILTTREQGSAGMNKGSHGYDNKAEAMQAMFVAHGPFSHHARVIARANPSSRGLTDWFKSAWNGGCHSKWQVASKDTYIMNTFQNVEIYNLIMKLLGIEHAAAPNNGTVGFWDQYL